MSANKLKPCPFCGIEPKIRICDDEGNIRPEGYRDDPWSGLGFWIEHTYDDSPECPVATHKGEFHGFIYESEEAAEKSWNTRAGCGEEKE